MTNTQTNITWLQAEKAPFQAFGILYYPVYENRAEFGSIEATDEDLAWAMTAATNLDQTAYRLSNQSLNVLMAYHHHMAEALESKNPVVRAMAEVAVPNPLEDILRLVPDVKATPMYPDYPLQVMEMDEATFRYHQMRHYASTYGVEFVAGLLGLDVTVQEGWLPDMPSTEKTLGDIQLSNKHVLHVVMDKETMISVVNARLAKATRMHPAEIDTALMLIKSGSKPTFGKIAFHENMLAMIDNASKGSSHFLADTLVAVSQHPGDLMKAILYLVKSNTENRGSRHLATRQKKAFCTAFETFSARSIAENIVDASKKTRNATNYLSVSRFGGPNLLRGINLVETGAVRSWNSRIEEAWAIAEEDGFKSVISLYGTRPGLLMRSLTRLVKAGCDINLLAEEVIAHAESYSLPTLVRNLTTMTALDQGEKIAHVGVSRIAQGVDTVDDEQREAYRRIAPLLLQAVMVKLSSIETPLKDKKVFLDKAGISLVGSIIMPNDTGDTGTAWPPVGIAYDVPEDKVVRFFTFWDDRANRVDVDLHFYGRKTDGSNIHVGWNSSFKTAGLVTSGDITTSHNSVEYLDIDMARARLADVSYVIQHDDIFSGRLSWGDIQTCYSGAILVGDIDRDKVIYDRRNLLFRDDMTGEGRSMDYALIDIENHYVRILRGTKYPFIRTMFTLEAYLRALFDAQGVTLVDDPEEADIEVCVGRSEKEGVISLFDEGFYIG